MRVAITLTPSIDDWEDTSAYVEEAERLGVDFVWSSEAWGHDAPTPLAFIAGRTSRIRLGTGIMQVGTRSPALVAMTAMSLASMSGGRFSLGLGVEGWHGIPFDRPVRRLRETVEIVRCATWGGRLAYKGDVYEVPLSGASGKALQSAARPRPDIPEGEWSRRVVPPGLRGPDEVDAKSLGLLHVGARGLPIVDR